VRVGGGRLNRGRLQLPEPEPGHRYPIRIDIERLQIQTNFGFHPITAPSSHNNYDSVSDRRYSVYCRQCSSDRFRLEALTHTDSLVNTAIDKSDAVERGGNSARNPRSCSGRTLA
jgi:hypothetical protein